MKNLRTVLFALTPLLLIVFVLPRFIGASATNPHSQEWLTAYRNGDVLPDLDNGLFSTAGSCESCHGSDPEGIASTTGEGEDVNVVDAWRASMMANSAKDPYWRAKMRQEMLNAPDHADETGHFCTKCHAPLGRHAHETIGVELYTFDHMLTDEVGLDGVSCVACHQQSTTNLGVNHSGDLFFEEERIAYGPFESPLASPMVQFSGYQPVYSEHIKDAGICAGCHTLITNTIDLEGNATGATFVEQATYHEWLNSVYADNELNITCQDCHMPTLGMEQPIVLAAGYDTPPRAPFARHNFAGANAFMLNIMRDYRDTLAIYATEDDFNVAISETRNMLQIQSIDLDAEVIDRDADTLRIKVKIDNLAGHRFPSGYPSRRVFIKVEVVDPTAIFPVFVSGAWDDEGYLITESEPFEPHHDLITSADQVQIYEMVMADVNGDPTTLLEQGAGYLKDNRLVPLGFSTNHAVYDTTLMAGLVLNDPNFNLTAGGTQGTGSDEIFYHIPMDGNDGALEIFVSVWYQAVPPKWTEELFELDDPLVTHFAEMYSNADKTPEIVRSLQINADEYVSVSELERHAPSIWYSQGGFLHVDHVVGGELFLYGLNGRMVEHFRLVAGKQVVPFLPQNGVYIAVHLADGKYTSKKIIVGSR